MLSEPTVGPIADQSVTIVWGTDVDAVCQVEFDEPEFVYGTGVRYPADIYTDPTYEQNHTVILDNLDLGTKYEYYIICTTASYKQAYWGPYTFSTTDSRIPTVLVIDGPTVDNITQDSITLSYMTNYPVKTKVEYSTNPIFAPGTGTTYPDVDTGIYTKYHTITIPGLIKGTSYTVDIIGSTKKGYSVEYAPDTYTTLDAGLYMGWIGAGQTGWFESGGTPSAGCSGGFNVPRGFALLPGETVVVADTGNDRVTKEDMAGNRRIGWIGQYDNNSCAGGSPDGFRENFGNGDYSRVPSSDRRGYNTPTGIGFNGAIPFFWVADHNNHRIVKHGINALDFGWLGGGNTTGYNTGSGTTAGSGDGWFDNPWDVVVDSDGNLYISNRDNHRIDKWDSDGNFIGSIGNDQSNWQTGVGNTSGVTYTSFDNPRGMTLTADGYLLVCDYNNHRVMKIQTDGTFLGWFGAGVSGILTVNAPPSGNDSGEFNGPMGVFHDPDENIVYIADSQNHRVQLWNYATLSFIGWLGGGLEEYQSGPAPGSGNGYAEMNEPSDVLVYSTNIYVLDAGNHRIQLWKK